MYHCMDIDLFSLLLFVYVSSNNVSPTLVDALIDINRPSDLV